MSSLIKKRTKDRKMVQLTVAVVCLFVTFVIPLNHTCDRSETCSSGSHFDRSDCPDSESHTTARFEVTPKQGSYGVKTLSHRDRCLACLYSISPKICKLGLSTSLISTDTIAKVQVLSICSFIDQFKWLSSHLLRAPPLNIS